MFIHTLRDNVPHLSIEITRRVLLIGSLVAVVLSALGITAGLALYTSWLVGERLSLNPWYSILGVDFLIVIFSAALAQHAEKTQGNIHLLDLSPHAAGVTCFMVSVGTLAPIASYAATIWRKLAGGSEYQPTFISALMCKLNSQSCDQRYFYIVVLLAVISLIIAAWTAHILHEMPNGDTDLNERWTVRGALPLGLSVFLFSAATLLHQGWDPKILENQSVTEGGYLGMIAVLLAAAGCFCWLALRLARAMGRARNADVRAISRGGSWVVALSWLSAITVWGFGFWLLNFSVKLVEDHVRELPVIREWFLAAVQLLGYFVLFWSITVLLCSLAAAGYAIAWGIPRISKGGVRGLRQLGTGFFTFTDKAFAFIAFLEELSLDLIRRGIEYLGELSPFDLLRWGRRLKDRQDASPAKSTEVEQERRKGQLSEGAGQEDGRGSITKGPGQQGQELRVPDVSDKGPWAPAQSRKLRGEEGPWRPRRPSIWEHAVHFVIHLWMWLAKATRALGKWLEPAGHLFRVMLALLTLPPLHYDLVSPVIKQRWEIPNELAWLPHGRAVDVPVIIRKPFMFKEANLVCPSHEILAWSYYDEDELHFSIQSCRFVEGSLGPCSAGAIVVVGRASSGGVADIESRRSLERGRLLANVLKKDYLRQCGANTGMRWYVLNMGQYVGRTLLRNSVAQREVSVFVAEGDADVPTITSALERYIDTQTVLKEYANCDLHLFDRLPKLGSMLPQLRCAR